MNSQFAFFYLSALAVTAFLIGGLIARCTPNEPDNSLPFPILLSGSASSLVTAGAFLTSAETAEYKVLAILLIAVAVLCHAASLFTHYFSYYYYAIFPKKSSCIFILLCNSFVFLSLGIFSAVVSFSL